MLRVGHSLSWGLSHAREVAVTLEIIAHYHVRHEDYNSHLDVDGLGEHTVIPTYCNSASLQSRQLQVSRVFSSSGAFKSASMGSKLDRQGTKTVCEVLEQNFLRVEVTVRNNRGKCDKAMKAQYCRDKNKGEFMIGLSIYPMPLSLSLATSAQILILGTSDMSLSVIIFMCFTSKLFSPCTHRPHNSFNPTHCPF